MFQVYPEDRGQNYSVKLANKLAGLIDVTPGVGAPVAAPAGGGRGAAARAPGGGADLVERAALVHDIGALGVSTGIWDKPGPWSAAERERVRTHPYLTERVLARPPQLAAIGAVASLHHERLDGSGYPRRAERDRHPDDRPHRRRRRRVPRARGGSAASARAPAKGVRVGPAGRVPGRPARRRCGARRARRRGSEVHRRPSLPAGLTAREVEVLEPAGPRPFQQADRPRARHLAPHGGNPRRAHLRQDRRVDAAVRLRSTR